MSHIETSATGAVLGPIRHLRGDQNTLPQVPPCFSPGSHHSPIPSWGWAPGRPSLFPNALPFPAFWELRTAPRPLLWLRAGVPTSWLEVRMVSFPRPTSLPIPWGSSPISLRLPVLHHWGLRTAPGSAHQRSEEGRRIDPPLVRLFSPTRASE